MTIEPILVSSSGLDIYRNIPSSYARPVSFAENIKNIRVAMKMTQAEFGDWLGVGQGAVSKWEREISVPAASDLRLIAEKTRQNVSALMGDGETNLATIPPPTEPQLTDVERRAIRLLKMSSPRGQRHGLDLLALSAKAFPRQRGQKSAEKSGHSHAAGDHRGHGTR